VRVSETSLRDGLDAAPAGNQHGTRRGGTTALRTVGFIAAIVLGILSVWLIVTGNSTKDVRIGALAGFWGLLIGGFAIFGRHLQQPVGSSSGVVDLRAASALDRPEDAAARMEFELRLVQMLRREVQESMAVQMERMHEDIAALRNEIIEKVGGDLRMERIETTRIFGSDIEALQREIEALKGQRVVDAPGAWTVEVVEVVESEPAVRVIEQEPATPAAVGVVGGMAARTVDERPAAPLEPAPVVQAAVTPHVVPAPAAPAYEPPPTPTYAPPAAPAPASTPPVAPAPALTYAPPPAAPAASHTPPPAPADPLAALPRLQPFTDFELDTPTPATEPQASAPTSSETSTRAERRRAEEGATGTHPAGGRRRREGDAAENNLLAQILQRESHD
jgi:hypothetical protein